MFKRMPRAATPARHRSAQSGAHPLAPGRSARPRVGQALGEWQRGELRLARSLPGVPRPRPRAARGHLPGNDARAAGALRTTARSTCATRCAGGSSTARFTCTATSAAGARSSTQRTPELALAAEDASESARPEHAAVLANEDRLIVAEFMTELSELERRVFAWMAEGMRYRAIAPVLQISGQRGAQSARVPVSASASASSCCTTPAGCAAIARTRSGAAGTARAPARSSPQRAFAHLERVRALPRRAHARTPGDCAEASRTRPPRCCRSRCSPASSAGSRDSASARVDPRPPAALRITASDRRRARTNDRDARKRRRCREGRRGGRDGRGARRQHDRSHPGIARRVGLAPSSRRARSEPAQGPRPPGPAAAERLDGAVECFQRPHRAYELGLAGREPAPAPAGRVRVPRRPR